MQSGKKTYYHTLFLFISILLLTSCGKTKTNGNALSEDANAITSLEQLADKRIGVIVGTTSEKRVRERFPDADMVFLNAYADLPLALKKNKIDAFVEPESQRMVTAEKESFIQILPEELAHDDCGFIFPKQNKELCEAFSKEIRQMAADGTVKMLEEKWFSGDKSQYSMPPTPDKSHAPKGVLKYATTGEIEPMTFINDGQLMGYDIEMAQLIAGKLGYRLEPVILNVNGYLSAVSSGKVSFGACCTGITEERKQKMLFSEPNYKRVLRVAVMKTEYGKKQSNTVLDDRNDKQTDVVSGNAEETLVQTYKDFKESFERTFIKESRWKLIVEGLEVTITITLLSLLLGTILAFGVCAMRCSKSRLLNVPAKVYIALIQGMPMLVILMILFYIVFAKVDINPVFVAVIGFSMNLAAYAGETFRSGINSIPKGQNEAAMALGFSRLAAFRKLILPQVIFRIMPVYRGEFVSMFKMTSIVGYIAIQDLTKMSDIIRSRTYEAFFPLVATAIIYFLTAHLLAYILTYIENRLNPKNRISVSIKY